MNTQSPDAPAPSDDLVPVEDIVADSTLVTELRRQRSVTPLTRALLAIVVVACAFLGGVLVEKSQSKTTAPSALPSAPANIAALFGRGSSTTVAGDGTGTTGGAAQTFGTIKLVDGKNVYVSDAQGDVVKVATNGATKITVSRDAPVSKLKPSTSVIVQGTRGSDGTITATSISETAGGASGFPGGLGRGAFPGGGAG